MPHARGFGIARSVRRSVPWRSCLQLSHRRSPEMCGVLRTRPRTDVDPSRFLPPSNCHRRGGAYRLAAPGAIPCLELKFANFSSVRVLRTQGLSFRDYKLRCRSKAAAASAVQRLSRDPARCSRVLARATCDVCPAFSWSVTDASVATLHWPRSARPEATRCRACVGVT